MAYRTRRATRAAPPRRRSTRAAPRRSSSRRSAPRRSAGGTLRIVVETPNSQFASVPKHLGEGGGIVPVARASKTDKARF